METLNTSQVRRLALARAGLLDGRWTGLPTSARGRGKHAREAVAKVVDRFGYLQLDTISIAGARTHGIVLLSRLRGLDPDLAEELLEPGCAYFEYWGHEACWMPLDLYPVFAFRRRQFRIHPWYGDLLSEHPQAARDMERRVRGEGPLRSVELGSSGGPGWWNDGVAKRVANALWLAGKFAISERRSFLRRYDLTSRVIPAALREKRVSLSQALEVLILRALDGHGWATRSTIAATWRLRKKGPEIQRALERLVDRGEVVACRWIDDKGKGSTGWIRPRDLELADALRRLRPRVDRGVLLSPFDPVLWDRKRVRELFGFDQVLEIYKPAPQRKYGYYCLPVLAGERLVARYDLKADRRAGRMAVLSRTDETGSRIDVAASEVALTRYTDALELAPTRV